MSRFIRIFRLSRSLSLASLFAMASVAVTAEAAAAADGVVDEALFAAIELHDAARDGNEDATADAVEALEALAGEAPGNATIAAYLGSSYALTARDANSVVDKIRYTNRALRYLDMAVTMSPQDFGIRVIRASVTVSLPSLFGRRNSAIEDMLLLDRMFEESRHPAMAESMVSIYESLADLAPNRGDWIEKAEAAKDQAGN